MCWFTRCTTHIICTVNTLSRVACPAHCRAFAQAMAAAKGYNSTSGNYVRGWVPRGSSLPSKEEAGASGVLQERGKGSQKIVLAPYDHELRTRLECTGAGPRLGDRWRFCGLCIEYCDLPPRCHQDTPPSPVWSRDQVWSSGCFLYVHRLTQTLLAASGMTTASEAIIEAWGRRWSAISRHGQFTSWSMIRGRTFSHRSSARPSIPLMATTGSAISSFTFAAR